jgi:hypothetical protein
VLFVFYFVGIQKKPTHVLSLSLKKIMGIRIERTENIERCIGVVKVGKVFHR